MSEFLFDIFENIVDVIDTVVDEVQKSLIKINIRKGQLKAI